MTEVTDMQNFMGTLIPFLLNPITAALAVVLVVLGCITLWTARQQLSSGVRIILIAVVLLSIVYILFVLWAVIGFDSSAPTEPSPMAP